MVSKSYLTTIDFDNVKERAERWANLIESRFEVLADVLLEYESFEVVRDEVDRTLDHLRSLKENKEFFKLRVGEVTTFLPRNQPLYALTCFVLVPSCMASEVHFRVPHSMKHFFQEMLDLLEVKKHFPNVFVSSKERLEFLQERSAVRVHQKTGETLPVTDVVIFTGTPVHADQLRLVFDKRTLFITNGSGHNPVVVSRDADLDDAVEAVLKLQLYNQGQDCAAPNSILIHKDVYDSFVSKLHAHLKTVQVGQYRNRTCTVGPIGDPKDLVRIQEFLIDHQRWIDPETPGVINAHDAILNPTVIHKPLALGGNYTELFAPIIFLQQYASDSELSLYFDTAQYVRNAMYVTLYGTSKYVQTLPGRMYDGKLLHDQTTLLINTHLHAHGVERGTKQYGGYGYGASNISIQGQVHPKPTLPQREIWTYVAKPLFSRAKYKKVKSRISAFKSVQQRDVQKLMKLKPGHVTQGAPLLSEGDSYVDIHLLEKDKRYVPIKESNVFTLRDVPHLEFASTLKPKDLKFVRAVRAKLKKLDKMSVEQFTIWMYALAGTGQKSLKKRKAQQSEMFRTLYQLLLGRNSGPRLAPFLLEAERQKILALLDV